MSTSVKMHTIPKCDICTGNDAAYDGRTNMGPWAYMCESCWKVHGVGKLGTGFGQRLELEENN